jgi:hypothetical protein
MKCCEYGPGYLIITEVELTGVAVCEEGTDGEQHLGDGQSRAPVVLQDVQANDALEAVL